MKSYKTEAPAFSLVLHHPWLMISTFFGSGCITPAPGTWGSFAAWLTFWLMESAFERATIWFAAALAFILGCIAVGRSETYLHKTDHGSIVIDEVVAVWLTLLVTPIGFFWQLASVIAFRFFDIVKLPPVSVLDSMRQNGFTVMLDDVFAAVYAIILINAAAYVFEVSGFATPIWTFF